ncbi:Uncharacterised protein [Mycobacteroides abscessus]|nr:Uncharacterised protein [Mycobacteroides abscessus]
MAVRVDVPSRSVSAEARSRATTSRSFIAPPPLRAVGAP